MPRIAIVHDYLFQFGGAEKVVEKWLEMYPEADLYTSFVVPSKFNNSLDFQKALEQNRIKTTWLQRLFGGKLSPENHNSEVPDKLPFLLKFFKHFFWLYPVIMSFWTIKNYDTVLISSTYCAKNVKFENCKKIIHYCHSPTRYLHGMVRETDLKTINVFLRKAIPIFTFWLRWMDLKAAKYLNEKKCIWVANSQFIKQTIQEIYDTNSVVIYPPIELNRFNQVVRKVDTQNPFYFYFGRISFHKKVELIVQACLELEKKVVIAGLAVFHPEMDKLKDLVKEYIIQNPASKAQIIFIEKRVDDQEVSEYLASCKALLYPPKEDSGMIPVEVFSSGTPVIAYKAGGALEYVKHEINGIFFQPQTVDGLKQGILDFEKQKFWDIDRIKQSSLSFSSEEFEKNIRNLVGF